MVYYKHMAKKSKKKRNKVYSGSGAAMAKPTVTRISAVNRSKFGQWWFERKRIVKPVLIASGVVTVLVWLIVELVRIVSN